MALRIETFSSLKGGNSFFKAVTHPEADAAANRLIDRLQSARSLAVYDPLGFAEGFWACRAPASLGVSSVYVQAAADIGEVRLGHRALPVTAIRDSSADLIFVVAFDAARLVQQISHLLPSGSEVVTLDAMRLDPALVTYRETYLNVLNFPTNFAFFRDRDGFRTRLATINYWPEGSVLALSLYGADGALLARWREILGPTGSSFEIDSRAIRERFDLAAFEGNYSSTGLAQIGMIS